MPGSPTGQVERPHETEVGGLSLRREIALYRERHDDLLGPRCENEGRYTLIHGDDIRGPFATRGDALAAGYRLYPADAFLVKKIDRVERVLHFTAPSR